MPPRLPRCSRKQATDTPSQVGINGFGRIGRIVFRNA